MPVFDHLQKKSSLVYGVLGIAAVLGIQAENAVGDEGGVPFHGFADVGGGTSSSATPENQRVRGFLTGTLDVYLNPEFENGVKSLLEIAFEPGLTTGTVGADVERIQVGYTFNDRFTLWAGRFHTPYGFWNTAFHHGAQLQTSIYRPRFLDFEDKGGILPSHAVGLWGRGNYRLGDHRLNYDLYLANGSHLTLDDNTHVGVLDPGLVRNDKDRFMFGGNLAFNFGGQLDGLTLGLHGFASEVNSYNSILVKQNSALVHMFGGYAVYDNKGLELLGEYYSFSNTDLTNSAATSRTSWAGYLQAGYNVTNELRPYFRYEQTSLDQSDSYFSNQENGNSYTRLSVGAKYDLGSRSAVKLELMNSSIGDRTNAMFNTAQMQYAVRF